MRRLSFWRIFNNLRFYKDDDEGTSYSFEDLDNSDMFEENESEDVEVEEYNDFDV